MKEFIKNRKGQKIVVVVEQPQGRPKGLAFVMHGLGGFKEQLHIRVMAEAFVENGYTTITFDVTNTLGESEGRMEEANFTSYYEDLEDVIVWSMKQPWFQMPFVLAGHSLGGWAVATYTQCYASQVKAVAPISAAVSGKLTIERHLKDHPEWERTGIREEVSKSKPGVIKRINWKQYKDDALKFDLLLDAEKFKMPVLMAAGGQDDSLEEQKLLFDKVPGRKEFHIIKGSLHTFREPEHLKELKEIFDKWIKSLD